LHYWWWRITHTIPPFGLNADFVVGIVFMIAETAALLAGTLSLLFLSRTKERSTEVEAQKRWLSRRRR